MIDGEPNPWSDRSVPSSLVVRSVTRPKRVVFLYDHTKVTLAEIDSATLFATECWGGAYWPFIPYANDQVADSWWSLLDAIDPDIVCDLHELSIPLRTQIVRRTSPLRILQSPQDANQRRGHGLIRRHLVGALSTAHMPGLIYAEQRFSPIDFRFLVLEDKGDASFNRTFALRNFGILTKYVRFEHSFDELAHHWLDADKKTPVQLLEDLARGRPITPRDMARFKAECPFRPEWSRESRSFWLVVGDSALDVALAWNSAVSQLAHLGRACLWLSREDAANIDLLAEVGKWIDRCFYSSQGSGEGLVLSYSESLATLEGVARHVRSSVRFASRVLLPEESLFDKFERPSRTSPEVLRTQQVPMRNDIGLTEFARPVFAPPERPEGGWMVDLKIEHPRDPSIVSFSLPIWKAPRRPGVASCFGASQHAVRISWERTPSFEILGTDSNVRFRVPTAKSLFTWCLVPTVVTFDGEVSVAQPHAFTMETSDAGLQLRGVLDLFGGLHQAGRTFENPFWRDLLTELAGRPENARARQAKAVRDVLLEAADRSGGILSESAIGNLAERVAEKAWRIEPSTLRLELANLQSKFSRFRAQWTRSNPTQSSFRDEEKFEEWAVHDLTNLIDRGVLFQGVSLRCPDCFTTFWLHVDDLRRASPCPGCLTYVSLPPNPRWTAQANELVAGAIRQRGMLTVIHALYHLQQQALGKTFTFIASQDVLTCRDGKRVTDLDVMVILDGDLLIGEVKSNARGFDSVCVDSMVRIAKVMLPDALLFIAEADGGDWPLDVVKLLEEAESELATFGVSVRRVALSWPP